jgi:hypothetical protein
VFSVLSGNIIIWEVINLVLPGGCMQKKVGYIQPLIILIILLGILPGCSGSGGAINNPPAGGDGNYSLSVE